MASSPKLQLPDKLSECVSLTKQIGDGPLIQPGSKAEFATSSAESGHSSAINAGMAVLSV